MTAATPVSSRYSTTGIVNFLCGKSAAVVLGVAGAFAVTPRSGLHSHERPDPSEERPWPSIYGQMKLESMGSLSERPPSAMI